jgi:hypothetical protein
LPASIRSAARRVLDKIGVTAGMRPRAAVAALVGYFRSFAASEDLPAAAHGPELYTELALSRKGVCRHRAYAFLITALEAGVPTRFVHNEAHAWVETFDGMVWHRIDLGGAAQRIDVAEEQSTLRHENPPDPYGWPQDSQTGEDLAQQAEQQRAAPHAGSSDPTSTPGPNGGTAAPPAPAAADTTDERPRAAIVLELGSREARRGEPLAVSGTVTARGEQCGHVRVDLALRTEHGSVIPLQPLPTEADGSFSGRVVLPMQGVDIGEYDVIASTPGNARCGPGQGE